MSAPPQALALRPGIEFRDGGFDGSGEHVMVLHDPVRHRFFRLPYACGEALRAGREPDGEALEFAAQMRLIAAEGSTGLYEEYQRGRLGLLTRLLHNYLSFRLPLVNPEAFLDFALPAARLLVSRVFVSVLMICGVLGLYFAGLQWEHFRATFVDFFTPAGAVFYGATLTGLKVFHELGHGFTARHFGVRVPVMGVNFMVLTPMLYTEASDAWRLSSRRQRFLIGAAGVLTEMGIAALALLAWAFLPDGPLRAACYFVAATAWVTSLAVNLSPFMRFDGYHMLVDLTGLHGLSGRAFGLMRWQLRELLFRPGAPLPEFFPRRSHLALIAYAWGTCIYRLGLFLGIALTVYHMFPKMMSLPLAWIEVQWFILNPLFSELKEWKAMGLRKIFAARRAFVTVGLLTFGLVLLLLPLDRHVRIEAVLLAGDEARVFAPEPARLVWTGAQVGDTVNKGQVLARLEVPDLAFKRQQAELRLSLAELNLARQAADARSLKQRQSLEAEAAAAREEVEGLVARTARLVITAPVAGRITARAEGAQAYRWLDRQELLFEIASREGLLAQGLVAEGDVARLQPAASGAFVAESGEGAAVPLRLAAVGLPGAEGIAAFYLSSSHGGAVTMAPDKARGREVAVDGVLPVVLTGAGPAPRQAQRGSILLAAEPRSLASVMLARVVSVVLRESGF